MSGATAIAMQLVTTMHPMQYIPASWMARATVGTTSVPTHIYAMNSSTCQALVYRPCPRWFCGDIFLLHDCSFPLRQQSPSSRATIKDTALTRAYPYHALSPFSACSHLMQRCIRCFIDPQSLHSHAARHALPDRDTAQPHSSHPVSSCSVVAP